MPTTSQIKTIQLGRKCLDLSDPQYRMLLRNVAGVDSSKLLDNRGVEDVMAVLEDLGFDSHPSGKNYWRDKVRLRGTACGERMGHLIRRLGGQVRYDLAALVSRETDGRTDQVDRLRPAEAWRLIEALKAMGAREQKEQAKAHAGGRRTRPSAGKEAPGHEAPAAATDGGIFHAETEPF